jgi:hypothetical protein
MSAQYYYQVSALPMLRFGEASPLTVEAFLAFCQGQLPAAVTAELTRVSLVPDGRPCCAVERRWQTWEVYLRNLLVRFRASRLGRDDAAWIRPEGDVFPGDGRRVEEILSLPDPLQRERELDRLRWQRLDDLAVEHPFDLGALVLYKLRLLLVSHWAGRTAAAGGPVYEALVTAGREQASASRVAVGTPEPR